MKHQTVRRAALAGAALFALVAASPAAKPEIGTFGFDMAGMDRTVPPGKSFYEYANGGWDKATEIPADRANYGMFTKLDDLSKERTRAILEQDAAGRAPGTSPRKASDYYKAFMDEAAIEAKGTAPLKAELTRLDAITDKASLARTMGTLAREGVQSPFGAYVNVDDKDPDTYRPTMFQSGLGLPDRDYYLQDTPAFVEARAKYKAHIANMLRLSGYPDPAGNAERIFAFENELAKVHWTRIDSRDADKTYNLRTTAQFATEYPGFDWAAFFAGAGLKKADSIIVSQPSAFAGEAKVIGATPLPTMKAYLAFKLAKARAPVLPKAFVDENFDFQGRALSGTPQLQERWKRGVEQTSGALGEAIGEVYVGKYFPPATKAEADKLVKNVLAAMQDRLKQIAWMDPATREKALAKLAAFKPKIGYPDKWRDYSALEVKPGDAYGNYVRASAFEFDRNVRKLGTTVDRGEWFMTPMTINAYANPTWNEIVFPAAILQPPFFDPNADPAVNYGGIGAVIGHEISHHFDDQGRKYDAKGRLTDWWTEGDVARFKTLTDRLVTQYDQYEPLPGMRIKGQLALGENIADVVGLQVSHDAYLRSLGGKPAPVIDGTTGDQRFYLGWAQVWRTKFREQRLRQQLVQGPHAPGMYRVLTVRNLDPWYGAFNPKPGETLYLKPEDRVKIW